MIDWMTVTVKFSHYPIDAGRIVSLKPCGEIDWESAKRSQVRGSYESSIMVKSQGELDEQGRATELYIDGNPSKFLQGHNVFGSDDLQSLLKATLERVIQSLCLGPVDVIGLASAKVHRLDYTHSIRFPTRQKARSYIHSLAKHAQSRTKGRSTLNDNTLYFQKQSRRWSLKLYTKGDELKRRPLPEELPLAQQITDEADTLVRAELTLRSLEFKTLEKTTVRDWTPTQLLATYQEYVGRIKMTTQLSIPTEQIQLLKRCYRDTYFMWDNGLNPADMMSEATFYRHRNYLLPFGVDISIPRDRSATAEIIPLTQIISGELYTPPAWAYQNGLIYQAA